MLKSLLLHLLILASYGCMTPEYFAIHDYSTLNKKSEDIIVRDFCRQLKRTIQPGDFTLYFPHEGTGLAEPLERKLKLSGYRVTRVKTGVKNEIHIAYQVHETPDDRIMVGLVVGRIFHATRVYEKSSKGMIAPAGPMLIRN